MRCFGTLHNAQQVRLSGWDQRNDGGTLAANPNLHFGSSLAVADLNDDGRPDLAAMGTITSAVLDGGRWRVVPRR